MDEPLSNLDAKLRVQMRIEIKKLQRRMNVTSIYVTHDQTEAMTLADRLAVINEGRVEQMGAPMELYSNPATLFVASFIGAPQINLLPVRFENGVLVNGDLRLSGFSDLPGGTDLMLGIRPDMLYLSDEGQITINVDLVEQHGGENLIYGAALGTRGDTGDPQELCLKAVQTLLPRPDERLSLGFDPAQALVFRRDTGARLK
jgi:sn-glycerol 3-phosphate transport system ATP-binding protein